MNAVSGVVRMNIAGITQNDRLLLRNALRVAIRCGLTDTAKADAEAIIVALNAEISAYWQQEAP